MVRVARAQLLWLLLVAALSAPVQADLACSTESPQLLEVVYTYKNFAPWEPRQRVHRNAVQLCARGELVATGSFPENDSGDDNAPADEPFPLQVVIARGKTSLSSLRAFRSILNENRVGVQQECYWPEVFFQMSIKWFGKAGRTNTFTVSPYQASLPTCSAGVRAIVEGFFRLEASYTDRIVLGL